LQELDEADGGELHYDATAPKHVFLRYLLAHRRVVLHGTGEPTIERFEVRRQTDYDNEWTNAVFATDDPIWPIFFAVVNRSVARSLVNGCSRRRGESHYYFSIGTDPQRPDAWRNGWIYVLPRETFRRLDVEPSDFPFLPEVTGHSQGDPIGRIVVRATLVRALRR
jgi:hypothetical protein